MAERPNVRENTTKEQLARSRRSEVNAASSNTTFADEHNRDGSRIDATVSSAIAPAPGAVQRFAPSDQAFIEEEQMARWGRRGGDD
jgi:hypothetical protein